MSTLLLSANKSCSEALFIFTLFKFRKSFSKQTFNEKRTLLTIEIILSSQSDRSLRTSIHKYSLNYEILNRLFV